MYACMSLQKIKLLKNTILFLGIAVSCFIMQVVSRYRDPQLQVDKKILRFFNLKIYIAAKSTKISLFDTPN